jgi:ricin-type beta-trefoil lectin protein
MNRDSGKTADVRAKDDAVVQNPGSGAAGQRWELVPVPTAGATYKLQNVGSGLVMDVAGQSRDDGGRVVQWTDNGGFNQQWQLTPAPGGAYTLTNGHSGLAVDIWQQRTDPGAGVQQNTPTGGPSQQWRLIPAS